MMVVVWLVTTLLVTRWSAPWVFGSALLACLLMGLVDINIVLAKATNEGLVTLVLLMLISVGFERLPWLLMVSRRMVVPSLTGSLLRVSLVTAVFSAFVNNTAVVATLAGVLRRSRLHAPSQLLLPLSYAAILGGTLTLIGTSTNLIVSSFLQEASIDLLLHAKRYMLAVGPPRSEMTPVKSGALSLICSTSRTMDFSDLF